MNSQIMLSYLQMSSRFFRSTDIKRDFNDPNSLKDYCLTDFGMNCLERFSEGLKCNSSQRAWRITGDYGSGKSSFALFLASTLNNRLPDIIFKKVKSIIPNIKDNGYLPLLIIGSRQSLAKSLLENLLVFIEKQFPDRGDSKLSKVTLHLLNTNASEDAVVDLISKITEKIISSGKGQGLLIILDEVGKYLEYAALNADKNDIFLLQRLAESASRSGDNPLFLVCLLHQGFNAYAEKLTLSSQKEWEKIAGRLEDIYFKFPIDQMMLIIESALSVKINSLERKYHKESKSVMENALKAGWYLTSSGNKILVNRAINIFPIDPYLLPVLVRTFQRFGQNERSMFNFIYSHESLGLRAFVTRPMTEARHFRLYDFYDYVRANFGHKLAVLGYRSHWSVIESMIESYVTDDKMKIKILKTIGILNLLNVDDLLATNETVSWAISGNNEGDRQKIITILNELKDDRILHYKGGSKSYCLWSYTSVDIDKAMDEAKRNIPLVSCVSDAIIDQLNSRPIVARRHYIETGNLRYFSVKYCSVEKLPAQIDAKDMTSDGKIIVPLCEDENQRESALEFIKKNTCSEKNRIILFAIPPTLNKLAGLVLEVQHWNWIVANTPELNSDKYAREEVYRCKTDIENKLQASIQDYLGLNRLTGKSNLKWFYLGEKLKLKSGREVLCKLSDLCDIVYSEAPKLKNELVNRQSLSSAAAGARMRLIEAILEKSSEPLLGMSPERKPPEMSMYLSVLKASTLHWQNPNGKWMLTDKLSANDPCHLKPVLNKIIGLIESKPDIRVKISYIIDALSNPPFGLRNGIFSILLAVIAVSREQELAFYENGTFLREIGKDTFLRLIKVPENFDIQFCKIEGIRSELFQRLAQVLELPKEVSKEFELLDVVKKLCEFVAQLPEYTRNTKRLSQTALSVRKIILEAREPVVMLFHDLPVACGFTKFEIGASISSNEAQQFVTKLKISLDELRMAFINLHDRMNVYLGNEFGYEGQPLSQFRKKLAERAEQLLFYVTENKLKAFAFRLFDEALLESEWTESIGSLLALRPPSKWKDEEEDVFERELSILAGRFQRAESVGFSHKSGEKKYKNSFRIAVTQIDGSERQEVIHIDKEEENKLKELQNEILTLISKNKRLGVAAASRVIWSQLKPDKEN